MKMTRRKAIILLLSGFAVTLFGFYFFKNFNTIIRKIIEEDTKHLKVSKEIIDQFMIDADKNGKWNQFRLPVKILIQLQFQFHNTGLRLPYYYKYVQQRSFILGNFLLSTDFFINKMEVNRKIEYIALHNPYQRPCSNPFSNLYYPQQSLPNM